MLLDASMFKLVLVVRKFIFNYTFLISSTYYIVIFCNLIHCNFPLLVREHVNEFFANDLLFVKLQFLKMLELDFSDNQIFNLRIFYYDVHSELMTKYITLQLLCNRFHIVVVFY